VSSGPFPTPGGGFVHPLLRARDWQDRPEFQALCQWWKDGGVGVCALVGIGGAGKTAIVERFLQVLPGGYPEHPRVSKDRDLAAPVRLFVFSFYDAPNPDMFFTEIAAWQGGRPAASSDDLPRLPSYHQVLELLAAAGKCLLVLDGLEKVQDDGARGGAFGQILDGRLRDFVLRVADGWLPQVSLVITSRFRLYDPLVSRTWYYRQIDIEKLQPHTAVQLLRDRDVRGTDEELEDIAREQGFHALSIDLVGGYIARFCGGDPKRFTSLTEPTEVADSALDPRIAAIREQERKFARLAEQYHQTLAESDPATLALLQRICLFRLGVGAETLASIFTGEGKEGISGSLLANLNERQLQAKLQLLVEMRLIEASQMQSSAQQSKIYTIHPAVRDGFLKGLDTEATRLGHEAAREGLEASLGGKSGAYTSDPSTLDLLEEIVYHTLAAGHVKEAWDIYWNRIGNFINLGWRRGAYERGERICRAFASGYSPKDASLPAGLSTVNQKRLAYNWGSYLLGLGQLTAAVFCFEHALKLHQLEEFEDNSVLNRMFAEVFLLAGRLKAGLHAAEEALRFAYLADIKNGDGKTSQEVFVDRLDSHACRALAAWYIGRIDAALADFAKTFADSDIRGNFFSSSFTVHYAHILARLGQNELAVRIAMENKQLWRDADVPNIPKYNLILADLAREQGDLSTAREFLHQAQEESLQYDAKESLCWSALVKAKIELSAFSNERPLNQVARQAYLVHAASTLEYGLRIARECGYGIYHIDLLLVRAQLALYEGRATDAERDVRVALDEGVHPPPESGFPELLAATDPECLYAWGIAEGRQLLAEALLLQAAQKLGAAEFVPKRFDRLPADVRDLIDRAREQLDQALELWRKLRDPESDADINPRGERTKRVLEGLEGGILTEYPIVPNTEPAQAPTPESTPQELIPMAASVFISYAHADNQPPKHWLDRFLVHLRPLVRQGDLAVWSDQQLKVGDEWNPEIQRQLGAAKVAVLLVSPAFLASEFIANSELPVLLRRAREDGLKILPVLLSPSLFHKIRFKWPDPKKGPEEFTLASLQAAGTPSETLSEMTESEQDRVFVALAERILEILGET
jgi:tetratricopeptide (TPR) repeat protein